jgi:hypothetical protein
MQARPGVRERIAWMLRVNRLFGNDERWAKASLFAAAFGGGCWPGTANESKISRWETAALRVPTLAIKRYEELLGLAPGLLTATAESVSAYYCAGLGQHGAGLPVARRRQVPVRRIEELIDKAGSSAVMTGFEWDELTREISALPDFYIFPSVTWEILTQRLLQEQIIADRVAWLQRFGALDRLLKHPVAQESAISVCAELGRDPTNQVGIEVMGAMDITSHPDASKHVLAQLTHPTSPMTFYGSLLACVRKVANSHFGPEESSQLAAIVVDLIGDGQPGHDDARTLAVSLLRRLPDDVPTAVAGKLRRAVEADESLSRVAATGKLGAPDRAGAFVARVVTSAAARMPREGPWMFDQMLACAVDEMLYDSVPDVRLEAVFLIHATPYRAPVATELTAMLCRSAFSPDTDLAICIMDALRLLGGSEHRPVVERLTLSPGVPAPVKVAAARNIGHLGGASDNTYWNHVVARHFQPSRRPPSAADEAVVRGLVYAMGMAHNDAMLTRVRDLPGVPAQARRAASWWLNHSERTRLSATL